MSGVSCGAGVCVLQLENNKIKIVDTLSDTVMATVSGLARNHSGYPAGLVADDARLIMNGGTGMVQVYQVRTGAVHSVDITQQNMVTRERNLVPHNSEVERVAVSADGQHLATVDCLWADMTRILLRFWSWSQETSNYCLNTQVEFPHLSGVRSMTFQPMTKNNKAPMLLTIGCDNKAKLWQLDNSWSCVSCLSFRQLPAAGGGWSSDGSVIGVAFGHFVTLWSSDQMNLKTTLSLNNNNQSITNLSFGRNTCSRFMYTTTLTNFIMWDLITLSPVWSLDLTNSPHTTITQSTSLPLVAIVHKEEIKLVSPVTKAIVQTFTNVNCTGGSVWMSGNLFFLKYSGELMKISKDNSKVTSNISVINSSSTISPWLTISKSNKSSVSVQPMTQGRTMHDIDALLALPLHTVPAPAQLSQTLIR